MLEKAGFEHIRITPKQESKAFIREWTPDAKVAEYAVSANIQASKPADT
jgi:hypothetical protein